MDFENIGATTLYRLQVMANRGHCKSIIVFSNIGVKAFGTWILTGEKIVQLGGWLIEGG